MRPPIRQIDRFAELLSQHDLATGDVGGNVPKCARRLGLKAASGNGLLQRLRRDLGQQAR